VGEHEHGLYAMPSLVDEQTLTISPTSNGPLLLEGPQNFQVPSEINLVTETCTFLSLTLFVLLSAFKVSNAFASNHTVHKF
jgi:hypothetical protein